MIKEGDRVRRIHPVNAYDLKKDGIVEGGIYTVERINSSYIRFVGMKAACNPKFFQKLPTNLNELTRVL